MKPSAHGNNLAVLYIALICILYYLFTSGMASPGPALLHTESTQYIETWQDGRSVIYAINDTGNISSIADIYNIDLKNGDKLTIENDKIIETGRISGIKSISLGAPIGLNSASAQNLTALPGIGPKTSDSIIEYRNNSGGFKTIDELDNVPGIGPKTLESLRDKVSLD